MPPRSFFSRIVLLQLLKSELRCRLVSNSLSLSLSLDFSSSSSRIRSRAQHAWYSIGFYFSVKKYFFLIRSYSISSSGFCPLAILVRDFPLPFSRTFLYVFFPIFLFLPLSLQCSVFLLSWLNEWEAGEKRRSNIQFSSWILWRHVRRTFFFFRAISSWKFHRERRRPRGYFNIVINSLVYKWIYVNILRPLFFLFRIFSSTQ